MSFLLFQHSGNTGKKLVVQDNHKPVFTNCSQYAPSVEEEKPLGTYVFQVKAYDKDPPDEGGTILYTFVSAPGERMKFEIDNATGVIKTRHVSNVFMCRFTNTLVPTTFRVIIYIYVKVACEKYINHWYNVVEYKTFLL